MIVPVQWCGLICLPGLLSKSYRVLSNHVRVCFLKVTGYFPIMYLLLNISLSRVVNNHSFHALANTLPGLLSEIYRVFPIIYFNRVVNNQHSSFHALTTNTLPGLLSETHRVFPIIYFSNNTVIH
jgi:hypothetical protein